MKKKPFSDELKDADPKTRHSTREQAEQAALQMPLVQMTPDAIAKLNHEQNLAIKAWVANGVARKGAAAKYKKKGEDLEETIISNATQLLEQEAAYPTK